MPYSKNQFFHKFVARTKIKLKICAYCENPKPIFRNIPHKGPQCEDCYRREKGLSKNKKAKQARRFEKTAPDLIKIADKKFSIVVRLRSAVDGKCNCFTCGTPMNFNEAQCGHFVPRANLSTRWLLDNCRPQCNTCNVTLGGNLQEFEKRLNAEVEALPERLKQLGNQVFKPSQQELNNIIKEYSKLAKELQ